MRLVTILLPALLLAPAPLGAQPDALAGAGLASLVAELERHNPELAAARREVDMHVARIAPAGAPPDPTLSVGYMSGLLRPPFFPSAATPTAGREIGVSQEIPFPGKLAAASRVAVADADIARWRYEDLRVRLAAELKSAYADYVLVERTLGIVRRFKTRLDEIRRIAEVQFTVGRAAQQDVIKAQLEISMLLAREASLERERAAIQARVNGLLYRAPDAPLDASLAIDAPAAPPSAAELRARAAERWPVLRREEERITREQQALALARKEVLPDFAVRVTSQQPVGGMPWMYGLEFMVTVPIFWQRKQRPMIAEATAALESARRMREAALADASVRVTEEHAAAETSARLIDLYADSILPQAQLALESSLASYQVGTVDFLAVLTNLLAVLTAEIEHGEQTAEYRKALARLEPLVGMELLR